MSTHDAYALPLADLELGDIVTLPDGRALTIRSRVTLPSPAGSMAGFVIGGELEILLASPASAAQPIGVYVPLDHLPASIRGTRVLHEGAARYWAPHLPAVGGAMGEITYEVRQVRGQIDPAVVVTRGHEKVVFIKSTQADPRHLRVTHMPRSADNELEVKRHSGTVEPVFDPLHPGQVPQPVREPRKVRRIRRLIGNRRT